MKAPKPPPMRLTPGRLAQMRSHYHDLAGNLRGLEADLRWGLQGSDRIPAEWSEIAAEPYCPVKEKLSLRVDEDVVRFFRATGQGYLTRMNKVLRTYMLARLAGVVQGGEREVPGPGLMEEYLVESTAYLELSAQRAAQAKAGQDVAAMDAELSRIEPRLRWLEGALGEVLGDG